MRRDLARQRLLAQALPLARLELQTLPALGPKLPEQQVLSQDWEERCCPRRQRELQAR